MAVPCVVLLVGKFVKATSNARDLHRLRTNYVTYSQFKLNLFHKVRHPKPCLHLLLRILDMDKLQWKRLVKLHSDCPGVNFSLQLKHSHFSLHLCISSQGIFLVLPIPFVWFIGPSVLVGLALYSDKAAIFFCGWSALFCCRCLPTLSSLILANSITFESVCGLNIWISEAMSSFSLLMNAPTNAFWGQPSTWLASFSNSRWYSLNVLVWHIRDNAL